MALYWRVWGAVALVILAVLTLFVVLATMQFGAINATLVGERLVVLADRTVAPFAAAVRLGLPLASVRNATALLERARQTDDAIVALHVFDDAGRIVHSTAEPPPVVPASVALARASAGGSPWHRETSDGFIGSVDIAGRDGRSVGGILVVYPAAGHATQVRAMFAELVVGGLAALAAACALAALVLRWGLAGAIRHHAAIEATLRDFERGAWRRAAGRPRGAADIADAGGLREALEAAGARYRATGHRLAAARDASA